MTILKFYNSQRTSLFACIQELSGPTCALCEFVMKELDSMLNSNTTEAEIKAALDKVCSVLPKSISADVSVCTCTLTSVSYNNNIPGH